MGHKFFSARKRPVHKGPYPLENLKRVLDIPDLTSLAARPHLSFQRPEQPESIVNAMGEFQAMLDAIRDGFVNPAKAGIPDSPVERADHLKAFGYFNDMSMVGCGPLPASAWLSEPRVNPDVARLSEALKTRQTKTLASGIDVIMADLRESMQAEPGDISSHKHTLVFVIEYNRDPRPDEAGSEWIIDAQAQRAALLGAEAASVLSNYIRLLGYSARGHTETSTDVDLGQLAVAAGLCSIEDGEAHAPWLGPRFGLAAVTTDMPLAHDKPLAQWADQAKFAPGWWLGKGHSKSALGRDAYAKRDYVLGAHPFEKLKRQDSPTTYIDEANVARVPKRTDMFARAQFGDMGKTQQDNAKGGHYVRKAAPAFAQRRALGAFVLLQDGESKAVEKPTDAQRNADNIKAASYFLSVDAVGLSRCPDWTWYSHDATGEELIPPHGEAISMIIDQGFDTTEGSSGDDWIAVAQSMRAYLRFSLLGGVIAQQIRNLGYKAKAHTVMDGEVLQPPLLLLAGLGEVSRIGEVILNPYLGPRLKSGVVTSDMPMAHDRPINFGLQNFCESCNKCARECPSGAITAGPKLMFNGYETWKSDSQKCTSYRIGTAGGAMCGRCMKTCPWNLEGLFSEAPFRWAASNIPKAAPVLAKLDDMAGNGNPRDVKKWWWDLELQDDGAYRPTVHEVNRRPLQTDLDLKFEDQTLAVYPAPLAPHPYPYPFPMDREEGIKAYESMIPAKEYQERLKAGDTTMIHRYTNDTESPVMRLTLSKADKMNADVTKYEFSTDDGTPLPAWTAGAHLDVLVSPEFLRQYSMSGNPADSSKFQIGVLREDEGRGGSALMHRIFTEGRKVFVSYPINHFELVEDARKTFLMGGGIGITPMIAFAHRLHALGRDFALHYSCSLRKNAGYLEDLANMPWADKVHYHFSDEGTRADLDQLLANYAEGQHVYTCGPERYMEGVIDAATRQGFPDEARHLEYFSVPEQPEYENHDFTLKLKDGRALQVPADKTATDVLAENGIHVDVKCSDGICGVCKCGLISGEVEHRDFVLSAKQREGEIILCQSRAAEADGVIEIDL
ncbi:2Fe-2S iron-sulfur cluster binding domain-containing protein [Lentibacter algarum]|uniref:2Fe-2S iron-sulfur cluster-binding protein n=1 Tax=Lentibacter algarum TaxID=576131 RepID=UPI001C06E07A|nr:2Fe-2S iron-sulfur cluster-binding protein [Lentibacter algarum]MBU2981570.1 2Fe-2S iron-sulfur cluster binding domain-containing protein [Lentibacter algarum]